MDTDKTPVGSLGRTHWAGVLVAIGLGLLAISLFWPTSSAGVASWTKDQALKYQASSAELHRLSHEYAHSIGTQRGPDVKAELSRAQREYQEVRAQLDSAIARPGHITRLLRISAAAIALSGVVLAYFRRRAN